MKKVYLLKEIGYGIEKVENMVFASKKDAKEWLQANNRSEIYDIIERTCYDSIDEVYQEKPDIYIAQLSWRKSQLKRLPEMGRFSLPFVMYSNDDEKVENLRNFILRGTAYFKRNGGYFSFGWNDYTEEEIKGVATYYRQLCIEINNINSRLEKIFNSRKLDKAKYNITDDELKPLQYDEFDDFLGIKKSEENDNFIDNYTDLE